MDYQMQQYKLLPLIASAYGLILTGQYMMQIYMRARAEIAEGNLESLPEVGIISNIFPSFAIERLQPSLHHYSYMLPVLV